MHRKKGTYWPGCFLSLRKVVVLFRRTVETHLGDSQQMPRGARGCMPRLTSAGMRGSTAGPASHLQTAYLDDVPDRCYVGVATRASFIVID